MLFVSWGGGRASTRCSRQAEPQLYILQHSKDAYLVDALARCCLPQRKTTHTHTQQLFYSIFQRYERIMMRESWVCVCVVFRIVVSLHVRRQPLGLLDRVKIIVSTGCRKETVQISNAEWTAHRSKFYQVSKVIRLIPSKTDPFVKL